MSYEKTFDLNYGMVSWPADTSTSPQEPIVDPVKELGFIGAEFATESDNPLINIKMGGRGCGKTQQLYVGDSKIEYYGPKGGPLDAFTPNEERQRARWTGLFQKTMEYFDKTRNEIAGVKQPLTATQVNQMQQDEANRRVRETAEKFKIKQTTLTTGLPDSEWGGLTSQAIESIQAANVNYQKKVAEHREEIQKCMLMGWGES